MNRYKTNTMMTVVLADGEIRTERLTDGDTISQYAAKTHGFYGARLVRIAYTFATIDTRTGAIVEVGTSHLTPAEVLESVAEQRDGSAARGRRARG